VNRYGECGEGVVLDELGRLLMARVIVGIKVR
jgi:hypothetical protein